MPAAIVEEPAASGHEVLEIDSPEAGIADVDIVYSTRLQEERFASRSRSICTGVFSNEPEYLHGPLRAQYGHYASATQIPGRELRNSMSI